MSHERVEPHTNTGAKERKEEKRGEVKADEEGGGDRGSVDKREQETPKRQ